MLVGLCVFCEQRRALDRMVDVIIEINAQISALDTAATLAEADLAAVYAATYIELLDWHDRWFVMAEACFSESDLPSLQPGRASVAQTRAMLETLQSDLPARRRHLGAIDGAPEP
jgi:hypothetical protein